MSLKDPYWPSVKRHPHILGEIRKVMHGAGSTSALYLYEQSVCRGNEPIESPPARATAMIGACNGIRCTICGELIDWAERPSVAYERLMGRYPRMKGSE